MCANHEDNIITLWSYDQLVLYGWNPDRHICSSSALQSHIHPVSLISRLHNHACPISNWFIVHHHLFHAHNTQTVHQLCRPYPIPQCHTTHPCQPWNLCPFQSPPIIQSLRTQPYPQNTLSAGLEGFKLYHKRTKTVLHKLNRLFLSSVH